MACVPYAAILDHIRNNLSRRIGVDELAAIARISVFELCRAFRREHETTPYALVLEVRVRQASAMLGAGVTIAEAAAQTGFADQSHLTRHFKRLTGMTPRQYATGRRDAAGGALRMMPRMRAGSRDAAPRRSEPTVRTNPPSRNERASRSDPPPHIDARTPQARPL